MPAKSATNVFAAVVGATPVFSFSSVLVNSSGVKLQWSAPTNEQFQVQWATNLAPVINWFTFSNILSSGSGTFTFTDTNVPLIMKFYRLLLFP